MLASARRLLQVRRSTGGGGGTVRRLVSGLMRWVEGVLWGRYLVVVWEDEGVNFEADCWIDEEEVAGAFVGLLEFEEGLSLG